jgi:hypothetical protein
MTDRCSDLWFHLYGDMQLTIRAIMSMIVAITWISGIDYIVIGWKQLRGRGDFSRADAVRIIGALALPMLLYKVLVGPGPAWPIFIVLAFELAVGGLDNCCRTTTAPPRRWRGQPVLRRLRAAAIAGGAGVRRAAGDPAAAVSPVGVSAEPGAAATTSRQRIREKARAETEAKAEGRSRRRPPDRAWRPGRRLVQRAQRQV